MNPLTVVRGVWFMATAPLRRSRFSQIPLPTALTDFEPPELAPSRDAASVLVDDIAVAYSLDGEPAVFPSSVLAEVDEPLAPRVPDLRGVWRVYRGPLKGHVERIEQAGNRVVITSGNTIHDMRADGTLENGVNDVAAGSGAPIKVAATFEDGRLNLRPGGRFVAVSRWLEGEELRFRWGPYRNRLKRVRRPDGVG